jgi:hypothetical protein
MVLLNIGVLAKDRRNRRKGHVLVNGAAADGNKILIGPQRRDTGTLRRFPLLTVLQAREAASD